MGLSHVKVNESHQTLSFCKSSNYLQTKQESRLLGCRQPRFPDCLQTPKLEYNPETFRHTDPSTRCNCEAILSNCVKFSFKGTNEVRTSTCRESWN